MSFVWDLGNVGDGRARKGKGKEKRKIKVEDEDLICIDLTSYDLELVS